MDRPRELSTGDIESFIERGFCTLRGAFSRPMAEAALDVVWRRLEEKEGIRPDDPESWKKPYYCLEEHLEQPAVIGCYTPRLCEAVKDLLGEGRWVEKRRWGLWPVSFYPREDEPDELPQRGWHIDGNWFRHRLDSKQQGLLLIALFTDIEPGGGGTVLAEGSHKRTAHVLARHPEGLERLELHELVLAEPLGPFHHVTGEVGDVVLAHPWLFHSVGRNELRRPRVITNSEAPLREPMKLDRDRAELSVLELSVVKALESSPPVPEEGVRCRW